MTMDSARKRRISRLGIVVIAAILVEVISIVQYERVKAAMEEEMGVRARVVLLVLLTRKIMDSIAYTRRQGQNVLTLTKYL